MAIFMRIVSISSWNTWSNW